MSERKPRQNTLAVVGLVRYLIEDRLRRKEMVKWIEPANVRQHHSDPAHMAVFLQIISAGFTLISARFLLEAARTAPERFADDLFGGDQMFNRRVRRFTDQRANELTGFALLLLAFASQMWDVLTPPTWNDFDVKIKSVISAVVVVFIVYLIARIIRNLIARKSWEKIHEILGNHAIAVDHWTYEHKPDGESQRKR